MTKDVERRLLRSTAIRWHNVLGRGILWTTVFFGAACSTTGGGKERPDWVDGSAASYPAAEFLLGRGVADSVELAQERARADLAKIFEVTIAAESSDMQRARGDGVQTRYEAASEQRIVTRTDQVVRGLRIAELWREPTVEAGGIGRQHALATLRRLPAATALRQEIATRDEAIDREFRRARATSDPLARAGLASRALDLARERAGFEQSLRVVDLGGRGVDTGLGVSRLRTDLDEQLKRVALIPVLGASGPFDDAGLLPLVRGAIAESGFVTSASEGATSYTVKINVRLNEQYQEGWQWIRGNIELSVIDGAGRVRGSQAWPIKASAQEKQAARARALLEIEALLNQELRRAVLAFAAS